MMKWLAVLLLITPQAWATSPYTDPADADPPSAVEQRLFEEKVASGLGQVLTAHRPTYILPLTYSFNPNDPPAGLDEDDGYEYDDVEIKFQFSLKALVIEDLFGDNGDLYFAYTQLSLWQAYDADNSAPFRDTNYEPEMFFTFDTDVPVFGLTHRMFAVGAVHQSNGRGAETLSRSWNRIYASFLLDQGDFALQIKPWYRIPEADDDDNNPDIEDYVGRGEIKAAYKHRKMEFAAIVRNNFDFDENRGSAQLDWTFPLVKEIRGYIQYFNGYGECLLDYDHKDERIGLGFMLGEWL